jgi:hypothetical protein
MITRITATTYNIFPMIKKFKVKKCFLHAI